MCGVDVGEFPKFFFRHSFSFDYVQKEWNVRPGSKRSKKRRQTEKVVIFCVINLVC